MLVHYILAILACVYLEFIWDCVADALKISKSGKVFYRLAMLILCSLIGRLLYRYVAGVWV